MSLGRPAHPGAGATAPEGGLRRRAPGWRAALRLGAWSGLVSSALLILQILLRARSQVTEASSPLLAISNLAAVGILVGTLLLLAAVVFLRLLGRAVGRAGFGFAGLLATASLWAFGPALICWVAFGPWNGSLGPGLWLSLAAALGLLVAPPCIATRLPRVRRLLSRQSPPVFPGVLLILAVTIHLLAPQGRPASPVREVGPSARSPALAGVQLPSGAPARTPQAVVLVSVDTLRADHLGFYGYRRSTSQALDRLAAEGLVVENMISASSGTVPSVATLLTGLDPSCHALRDQRGELAESLTTLAELFKRQGFHTAGFVANPLLIASSGFAQGFDEFHNSGDVPAPELVEIAVAHLETAPSPLFLWLHFMDPHTPYEPDSSTFADFLEDPLYSERRLRPVDYGSYGGVKLSRTLGVGFREQPSALEEGFIEALYDGEIRTVDRAVAELLEWLRLRFADSELLVALTSDHGETLARSPHDPYFQHALDVYQSTVRIPALLWAPGRVAAGGRAQGLSRMADLPTTLLQLSGVAMPQAGPAPAGANLAGAEGGAPREREVVTQTAWWDEVSIRLLDLQYRQPTLALTRWPYKLIRYPREELMRIRGPRTWLYAWRSTIVRYWREDELFDLAEDPRESHDLAAALPAVVNDLRTGLERHLQRPPEPSCPAKGARSDLEAPDPDKLEALRALGYLD